MMKWTSLIISRYLIAAILPYFVFSWVLLSVILFVQQASRFSDIFFNVNIPGSLVWQLALALIPNVIAFTCPMAILVGTIIGLVRMQSDSELIAIRAAGVGTLQIALPIALLGVLLSAFAFIVNLRGVPLAAALVRSVALQTAIKKLESPIEPGVFNTEVAGYTIYVKGGDVSTGRWRNIFIHTEDAASGTTRLITSTSGRIDLTDQASELVLENATVSTIPSSNSAGKFVSENVGEVRFAIRTRRGELIEKLSTSAGAPEELGLAQLAEYAKGRDGRERTEANILWYRRIVLSITPLLFCLLGTAMMLRFNRTGRGVAIAMAFAGLIVYYFLAFGAEQLARTDAISPLLSAILAPAVAMVLIVYLWTARGLGTRSILLKGYLDEATARLRPERLRPTRKNLFVDLTTGLRDFDMGANLAKYFLYALIFLSAIFVIFTAFELWKFAGTVDGGFALLAEYLFYLLPFVYLQLVPSATLIAVLATYVIKSRQNEIVTWISAGQSVYRLLLPCFALSILIGLFNYGIQEKIAPQANIRQDETRMKLRKGGVMTNTAGRFWVANDRRIYSFELSNRDVASAKRGIKPAGTKFQRVASREERGIDSMSDSAPRSAEVGVRYRYASDNDSGIRVHYFVKLGLISAQAGPNSLPTTGLHGAAWAEGPRGVRMGAFNVREPAMVVNIGNVSDNDMHTLDCSRCVSNLVVYEFSEEGTRLQTVYRSTTASWLGQGVVVLEGDVERSDLSPVGIVHSKDPGRELSEDTNPFAGVRGKPSHLTAGDLQTRILESESDVERKAFSVALHRRYSTLIMPLVIALFTAPFALSLSRKGKAVTVGYAVGLWLAFTGVTNLLAQFGDAGSLQPGIAVWAPLILFAMLGVYLLSRLRT